MGRRAAGRKTKRSRRPRREERLKELDRETFQTACRIIGRAVKAGRLTIKEADYILKADIKDQALLRMLSKLNSGALSVEKILENLESLRKRKVPPVERQALLKCPKGQFYRALISMMIKYKLLRSFFGNIVFARARELCNQGQIAKEVVKKAYRLKWDIHKKTHTILNSKDSAAVARAKRKRRQSKAELVALARGL